MTVMRARTNAAVDAAEPTSLAYNTIRFVTFCTKMQRLLSWLDRSLIVNISNEVMLTYLRTIHREYTNYNAK